MALRLHRKPSAQPIVIQLLLLLSLLRLIFISTPSVLTTTVSGDQDCGHSSKARIMKSYSHKSGAISICQQHKVNFYARCQERFKKENRDIIELAAKARPHLL